MINKIMALLAKAESITFEAERDAYLAKAQELMIKNDIDRSRLKPEDRDKVVTVKVKVGAQLANRTLWFVICASRGVSYINLGKGNARMGCMVGFEADILFVQAVVTSLMMQRERALGRTDKPWDVHDKTWGASFRLGFGHTVSARLAKAKAETVRQSGPGTDLVLADKQAVVMAEFTRQFPKVINRSTRISVRATDAYSMGRQAGHNADLSGGTGTLGRTGQRSLR